MNNGQIVRHLGVEREAHCRCVELNGNGYRFHCHHVASISQFQPRVHGNVAARLDKNIFLNEGAESGHLYLDRVGGRKHEIKQVDSGGPGNLSHPDACLIVDESNVGTGHYRARGIGDGALHFRPAILGGKRNHNKQTSYNNPRQHRHAHPFYSL